MVRLPPKPTGQLGIQYVIGAAWAWAVRVPRQSAANANATPNLAEKMDIRATAKCAETIPAGYQKRQCGADGRRITSWFIDGMLMSESLDLLHAEMRT